MNHCNLEQHRSNAMLSIVDGRAKSQSSGLEIERKVTLFHSNMKPLQTLAGQALHLTAEQFQHRHKTAITTEFISNSRNKQKSIEHHLRV